MLYNDAFIPTLGTKHPARRRGPPARGVRRGLGRDRRRCRSPCSPAGPATWDEDLPLTIERGTGPEETFFTFSYSHVPDEEGTGGVLAVLSVTTDKVVAARRLALLNELAGRGQRGAPIPTRRSSAALEVLGRGGRRAAGRRALPPGRRGRAGADRSWCSDRRRRPAPGRDPPPAPGDRRHGPVRGAACSAGPRPAGALVAAPRGRATTARGRARARPAPAAALRRRPRARSSAWSPTSSGQILTVATARAARTGPARGAGRARRGQDRVPLQRQPRVPHPADPRCSAPRGRARRTRPSPDRAADVEVMYASAHRLLRHGQRPAGRRPHRGRRPGRDLGADRPRADHPRPAPAVRRPPRGPDSTLEADLDRDRRSPCSSTPALWEKIVVNLVANAIKFTLEGSVRVDADQSAASEVVLRVTDTGVGIPAGGARPGLRAVPPGRARPAAAPSRAPASVSTLVAEAARAMGGSATVDVRGWGPGPPSRCALPWSGGRRRTRPSGVAPDLRPRRPSPTTSSPTASPGRPGSRTPTRGGPTGHPGGRGQRGDALPGRAAAGRARARSGRRRTAWRPSRCCASEPVDLVVTDVMMPRLDGLGLLAEIRADEALRGTPVVLLSARAGSEAAAGGDRGRRGRLRGQAVHPRRAAGTVPHQPRARATTARAAAAGQVRGALLAGVSHDMQTPLAVITTSLGLLGEPDLATRTARRIASRARVRASQLTRLVTQFLDWSRLSMNQPLPDPDRARGPRWSWSARSPPSTRASRSPATTVATEIRCDRQRTEQILHNLVDNAKRVAARASRSGSAATSDDLTVRVVDDGAGVSPEVLARLFEAFGPSTALRRAAGSGLHVSREAARAQGGDAGPRVDRSRGLGLHCSAFPVSRAD